MNVKKTGLYILIILLLILLLFFFICNKKSVFNDGDSSDISDSEIGQIGYMKDVTSENGEDEFVSSQPGAGYKAADGNKGTIYSVSGKDSSSGQDLKIADEKKEASVKPPVSSGETKSSRDETIAKDKIDTKESQEKSGEVKVAEKTEKDAGIKSADAVKADEKALIAKGTVADKTESRDKIPGDSDVEKAKDKVSEDAAGSASKEKAPLKEEQVAVADGVIIPKQEDEKVTGVYSKSGRLDRIRLYSGRELTGTVTERGDNYIIIVNEGKEKISTNDIQGNEIIK